MKQSVPISILRYYLFITIFLAGCQTYIDINPSLPAITRPPKRIVLLLPLEGEWKAVGMAIQKGFDVANQLARYPLDVRVVDTTRKRVVKTSYLHGAENDTDLIIGPLLKSEVSELSKFRDMKKPVLTLNYLSLQNEIPANFYQFGLSSLDEARQAALQAWQQGLKNALVITPKDHWGQEVSQAFRQQWELLGGKIIDQLNYSVDPESLSKQLQTFLDFKAPDQRRNDFDMIFLGATSPLGRQINPLLAYYFAANIPIYATSAIYDQGVPSYLNRDLDPIMVCDTYWNLDMYHVYPELVKKLQDLDPESFKKYRRYYGLGVDAFYLAMQLVVLDQDDQQIIEAASGRLFLNRERCFVRTMPYAQFKRGVPVIINQGIDNTVRQ